jgi:hypothetical protein
MAPPISAAQISALIIKDQKKKVMAYRIMALGEMKKKNGLRI